MSSSPTPTPCRDFTVGDLIDHVDQVSRGATALARSDIAAVIDAGAGAGDVTRDSAWRDMVANDVRALDPAWDDPAAWQGDGTVPGSDLSNEMWAKIALTELVVHGWDIAQATGQPFDLPQPTLQACLDHVTEFVPNAPAPGLWGPPVEVAPDARLLDRIVAITGRTP